MSSSQELYNRLNEKLRELVHVKSRNRYFQNVLLTRETKLQTSVSVIWTTDEKGKPGKPSSQLRWLAGLACESTAFV